MSLIKDRTSKQTNITLISNLFNEIVNVEHFNLQGAPIFYSHANIHFKSVRQTLLIKFLMQIELRRSFDQHQRELLKHVVLPPKRRQ